MGSSGGGMPRAPTMPVPAGTQVPYGQTSPAIPQYTSFLPSDPNAMATGLTPQMLAAINTPPAPPPVPQAAAAPAAAREQLAQLLAGRGLSAISQAQFSSPSQRGLQRMILQQSPQYANAPTWAELNRGGRGGGGGRTTSGGPGGGYSSRGGGFRGF